MAAALIVATLVSIPPAAAQARDGEFPIEWFNGHNDPGVRGTLAAQARLLGKPMPRFPLKDWMNVEGGRLDLHEDLKGKVIVIDLWATWCGPCLARVPHNNELYEKYKDDGLVFIGICGGSGQDSMAQKGRQTGMEYPIAKDYTGRAAKAFHLAWWPTYAFIDRSGNVRAVGLLSGRHEEQIIRKLLAEEPGDGSAGSESSQPEQAGPDDITRFFEGEASERSRLQGLQDTPEPPALSVTGWLNTRSPLKLDELKGKIVLLNFWATWSAASKAAIPKLNRLHEKYEDTGLVIIGICDSRGAAMMKQIVEEQNIAYPVCSDVDGETFARWRTDGLPDCYLIDRTGRLRIADCKESDVENAVEFLLRDKADSPR